jgi:leucine-rich repeat protein SHOC2
VTKEEYLEYLIEQKRIDLSLIRDAIGDRFDLISDDIGNLSHLTKLSLYGNQLTTLPESLGSLCNLTDLDLHDNYLSSLPESIGNIFNLTKLDLSNNELTSLPESIGNLMNLTELILHGNKLSRLPESFTSLTNLKILNISRNQLNEIPENIGDLSNLTELYLHDNIFANLPINIGNLSNLIELELSGNQIISLPQSIGDISSLTYLSLNGNPINDLSALQPLTELYDDSIEFLDLYLPRKYWTKFSSWNLQWLLEENNIEIRRILIEQVGYERICQELDAIDLDTWREYTLLKIDADIDEEPMVLLKMTCPSTGHIHILRVPPEMTSAEAAISWINHGIHPDEFTVQT